MIRSTHLPLLITIATFVLAYTLCASQYPAMLSTRVVANLLTDNAFLGIAAVGMTFVILSGGIDLSVGSVIAFTGVFLAVILRDTSIHPLVAFVLVLAITISFGAAMGAMIHYLEMPPFIVTLAGMFLARGAAYVLSTDSVPITHEFYDTLAAMLTTFNEILCERGLIKPMNFRILAFSTIGQVERIVTEYLVSQNLQGVEHRELVEHLVVLFLAGTTEAIASPSTAAVTGQSDDEE